MKFGLLFEQHLSAQANSLIKSISQIATDLDRPVYLVGGAVRDVLLGRSSNDLDFVIVDAASGGAVRSGIKLSQMVCERLGGELTTHDRFGTAVWTPPSDLFDFTIDFITARKESYSGPAALPDVVPSNMRDDLFRRDFTVNALAVRLDGEQFGELLDFYDGQADLKNKLIRILHPNSFADDPTRVFRALRYAARVDFNLADETLAALQKDVGCIKLLSADRIRHELEKVLSEPDPEPILEKLSEFQVLKQISADIDWEATHQNAFKKVQASLKSEPGVSALIESGPVHLRFLSWICASQKITQTANSFSETLNFSADLRRDLEAITQFCQAANQIPADARPGTVEKAFRKLSATQLTILQTADILPGPIKKLIPIYFEQWRKVKTFTDGNTLRQMGLRPGPNYKVILDALLEAKLNGDIETDQDEAKMVKNLTQTRTSL